MKVSFLVTYYDQEKYVDRSMKSILKIEKPCEYEILIGDDGSKDGTRQKVQKYIQSDPERIHLFVMERDQSQVYDPVERASALRAYLLKRASGDFFCILDGDDWYCSMGFIKKALGIYGWCKTLTVVAFGYQKVTGKRKEIADTRMPEGIMKKKTYIRKYYTPAGACVFRLIHNDAFQKKIESCIFYDDNDITLNNLAYGDMYYCDEVVYSYRQTVSSIYHSMDEFEKCVLNTLGYDSAAYYLPQNGIDMMMRCLHSVLTVLFLKKHVRDLLDEGKYKKYLEQSRMMGNSLSYMLLKSGCKKYVWNRKKWRKYLIQIGVACVLRPKAVLSAAVCSVKIMKKQQERKAEG